MRPGLSLVYHVSDEERRLRALARQLGLDVRFLGVKRPEELRDIYAAHHALVLPSRAESLPSVVTEALMVGRPVIATCVGAVVTRSATSAESSARATGRGSQRLYAG